MSKRWTMEDDEFLAACCDGASGMADYIASHDLGHHGKNAGTNRIKRLKETGVWGKLIAAQKARQEFVDAHIMAFGPQWAKEMAAERQEFEDAVNTDILASMAPANGRAA